MNSATAPFRHRFALRSSERRSWMTKFMLALGVAAVALTATPSDARRHYSNVTKCTKYRHGRQVPLHGSIDDASVAPEPALPIGVAETGVPCRLRLRAELRLHRLHRAARDDRRTISAAAGLPIRIEQRIRLRREPEDLSSRASHPRRLIRQAARLGKTAGFSRRRSFAR